MFSYIICQKIAFCWVAVSKTVHLAAKSALDFLYASIHVLYCNLIRNINKCFSTFQDEWNGVFYTVEPFLGEQLLTYRRCIMAEVMLFYTHVGDSHLTHSYKNSPLNI